MDKGMRGEVSPFNLVSIVSSPGRVHLENRGNYFSVRMFFDGVGPSGIGAMRVADAQTGWRPPAGWRIARMGSIQRMYHIENYLDWKC